MHRTDGSTRVTGNIPVPQGLVVVRTGMGCVNVATPTITIRGCCVKVSGGRCVRRAWVDSEGSAGAAQYGLGVEPFRLTVLRLGRVARYLVRVLSKSADQFVAITGNAQPCLHGGHQPLESGTSAALLTSSHHRPTFSRTGSINRISPPFRCPFPLAVRRSPPVTKGSSGHEVLPVTSLQSRTRGLPCISMFRRRGESLRARPG